MSELAKNETEAVTVVESGCAVVSQNLVYAWTKTKAEFDMIALPETVHAWEKSNTVALLRGDGKQWERRVFSKALEGGSVCVIFQWFEERHVQADTE